MNVLIVDTSTWIDFFRGKTFPDLESALREARVVLSPLVAAELLSGVPTKAEEKALKSFLSELKIHETPLAHWYQVGLLRSSLARQGLAVSIPDSHVAQCALDLNGYLMSRDKIFQKIGELVSLKLFQE